MWKAVEKKRRIEVTYARTETSTTYVNPDGTGSNRSPTCRQSFPFSAARTNSGSKPMCRRSWTTRFRGPDARGPGAFGF
jgi:hypothetical protein